MTSHEIRRQFLDFFRQKNHQIVPSAPLILKNDPTLMFANSGMVQFKDYFLGNQTAPSPRIADTQKCLRVTGKHNDLEDVGHDTYHHTLFEMLGNWSFGDYFKEEAIAWSWELLTEVYKLPKDRLYATVFEGDANENLAQDSEAYKIWLKYLPENQILFGNKKDNFWEMGAVGPCGPCSEIHIDLRDDHERTLKAGRDEVNRDNPQVVEIWNNVFMQFERLADKSLKPLSAQHVDTGMGFERLCMAIQGKKSNYDTDVFQPIIQFVAGKCQIKYGANEKTDIALRVVADHIRAISFTIADGQMPSNNGAGYVIKRILRRAVRYGYSYLGFKTPFLHSILPLLAEQFKDVFPELFAQKDFVENVILQEEISFLKTLENGIKRIDNLITTTKNNKKTEIQGNEVFELYDTFGFPLDLTALIAKENSLSIDEKGFEVEMKMQKDRARQASAQDLSDWVQIIPSDKVEFLGYDTLFATANLVKYRQVSTKNQIFYQIVLDKTPFYAESGGQVGDVGELTLQGTNFEVKIPIFDTKKENDLIIHLTQDKSWLEYTSKFQEMNVLAQVDAHRRGNISANHSATHLLHSALREVLGKHIAQKGSLVNDEGLRFDFSHFEKISPENLLKIENIANERIRQNIILDEQRNVPIKKATEELGATALFGEKYGEFVRVITFDASFSRELCGGTHVSATGKIGGVKIVAEGSSASGVRRIEAITGEKLSEYITQQTNALDEIRQMFNNPKDLKKAISDTQEEKRQLLKKIEHLENEANQVLKNNLLQKIQNLNNINFISQVIKISSAEALKNLVFELRNQVPNLALVLGTEIDEKPFISVAFSDSLLEKKPENAKFHAGNWVKELAKHIQGGGGGQPHYALAGGKDVAGLTNAIAKAQELL